MALQSKKEAVAAAKQAKAEARRADVEAFNKRHEAHIAARKAKADDALPAVPASDTVVSVNAASYLEQNRQQAVFSQYVGRIQAFGYTQKTSAVAELLLIKQIRESKIYKGMRVHSFDGEAPPCGTFEDFCAAIGRSHSKVAEDLQNLEALGADFLEYSNKMGLGRNVLRQLRALPEEERALIIEGEKVSTDPTAMKEFLEELVAKQTRDKDKLQKELDKTGKDLEASRKVAADEHTASLNLKEELIKLKTIPPDEAILIQGEKEQEALKDLHKESLMVLGAWTAYLARAVAVRNLDDPSPNTVESVHAYTTDICDTIAKSIQMYALDVEFRPYAYADLQNIPAADADPDADPDAETDAETEN
jgi:hypothetical protein